MQVEFTIPQQGEAGATPAEHDPDQRAIFQGSVHVAVVEGVGKRASRTRAVATRAGIHPEDGLEIAISARLKSKVRPAPPTFWLRERTPYDFTVAWRAPEAIDGDGDGSGDDAAEITYVTRGIHTSRLPPRDSHARILRLSDSRDERARARARPRA